MVLIVGMIMAQQGQRIIDMGLHLLRKILLFISLLVTRNFFTGYLSTLSSFSVVSTFNQCIKAPKCSTCRDNLNKTGVAMRLNAVEPSSNKYSFL